MFLLRVIDIKTVNSNLESTNFDFFILLCGWFLRSRLWFGRLGGLWRWLLWLDGFNYWLLGDLLCLDWLWFLDYLLRSFHSYALITLLWKLGLLSFDCLNCLLNNGSLLLLFLCFLIDLRLLIFLSLRFHSSLLFLLGLLFLFGSLFLFGLLLQ